MEMTAEISLYPLSEKYEDVVLLFLERLALYPNIRYRANGMSTQIFGDSSAIFPLLEKEFTDIQEEGKALLVMKAGPGTLHYEGKHSQ